MTLSYVKLLKFDDSLLCEQRAQKLSQLLRSQLVASLKRLVDGSGLIHHSNTGYASNWVTRPGHKGRLAGREYVGAMQVRLN